MQAKSLVKSGIVLLDGRIIIITYNETYLLSFAHVTVAHGDESFGLY